MSLFEAKLKDNNTTFTLTDNIELMDECGGDLEQYCKNNDYDYQNLQLVSTSGFIYPVDTISDLKRQINELVALEELHDDPDTVKRIWFGN